MMDVPLFVPGMVAAVLLYVIVWVLEHEETVRWEGRIIKRGGSEDCGVRCYSKGVRERSDG
jgi:hypothetical protein